jgi:hypothetical protein
MDHKEREELRKILADAKAAEREAKDQQRVREEKEGALEQRFLQLRPLIHKEFSEMAREIGPSAKVIQDFSKGDPDPPTPSGNFVALRIHSSGKREATGATLCLHHTPKDPQNVWIYRRGLRPDDRSSHDPDETIALSSLTVNKAKELAFAFIRSVFVNRRRGDWKSSRIVYHVCTRLDPNTFGRETFGKGAWDAR